MPAFRINVGLVVKPLICGSLAISRMPSKSAPSAKILTFKCFTPRIRMLLFSASGQNNVRGFREGMHGIVRGCGFQFTHIVQVDKDSLAARGTPGFDIAGTVSNHDAGGEIYAAVARGIEQHARLR